MMPRLPFSILCCGLRAFALLGALWVTGKACAAPAGSLAELIYSFPVPAAGPLGELVQGADQSLYGSTSAGGASGAGTVFKIAPDGTFHPALEFSGFTGSPRGAQPSAKLVLGGDGNYYGVNAQGGTAGFGTIFKVLPDGSAVDLVTFTGTGGFTRGALPYAALLPGGDGFLYGTTSKGGPYDLGTIFKISETSGSFTTLVDFNGKKGGAKGAHPYAALVKGPDGLLYGVTAKGGKTDHGTIFSLTTAGTLTTLVEFTDRGPKNKGAAPYATLTLAGDGTFYGTTARGGAGDYGTIFQVTTAGVLKTLAEFTGRAGRNRGAQPEAALAPSVDGNFYGTTLNGGKYNVGTVFKVTPAGQVTTMVEFTNAGEKNRGSLPQAGLTLGADGNFHGTTLRGGAGDAGTIFRMTPAGELTTLLELAGVDPVTYSQPGIIRGQDDNFYGVTAATGLLGKGSVFRIAPAGSANTIAEFTGIAGGNPGTSPKAPLLQAQDGSFYGVTLKGGAYDLGTIFKITAAGELTTLVEFTGNGATNKGALPRAALIQTGPDDFYGVTSAGGGSDAGTVFHLTGGGTLTTLVEFTGNGAINKGAGADAPLLLGSDGNLHGTTAKGGAHGYGTVFTMTPQGALTTQVEFADAPTGINGAFPEAPLIQANDGNYYGTTATGGASGDGTLFRLTPAGELTTLVEFTGRAGKSPGTGPTGALLQASDGHLYGTTSFGGAANYGTAFRLTLGGVFTTIAELNYRNGAYPETGFVVGSDGNLYTTSARGGTSGAGAVFRIRLRAAADVVETIGVTPYAAQLRARLKKGGLGATVYFEYGLDNYDQRTPDQVLPAGTEAAFATADLTGLEPNTAYLFRVVIVDSSGTVYGRDESFVTGPAITEVLATKDRVTGEPPTTTIAQLGIPSIADNQAIAVSAILATESGQEAVLLAGAPPVVLVRQGSAAPISLSGAAATFTAFDDPLCDATGRIAFRARILLNGKPASGLWTNSQGSLAEVARVGGPAPTISGGKLSALTTHALSRDGVVFFAATMTGSGISPTNNAALWAFDAAGHHLLLRKGELIAGQKITAIAALGPVTGSTGQGRGYFGNALMARVTLADGSQALVQVAPGAAPIILGPTPYPLAPTPPSSVVTGFGAPSLSAGGSTAFRATLQGEKPAIVADLPAADLALVAQAGAPAPGADGAVFATLADPVYNAQFQVAFPGTLAGAGVTKANQNGLWWRTNSGLSLIGRTGAPVPTIPAAKWSAFLNLALPDNARPVFLAKLAANVSDPGLPSDVKPTTNLALFAVDANRARRLLVRTGDILTVRGEAKKLSLIAILGAVPGAPGQARSYNAAGDLIFRAGFTDRSQAVMKIHLP